MKNAEDWLLSLVSCQSHLDRLMLLRAVQADALRWAANLTGVLSRVTALDKADELDPPPKK